MGSRIRDNVKHYFECFCEVVGPQPDGSEPWIIQKFPESYRDEEVLKSVPKFSFPCEFENTNVQHYSFVLTDHDSKWTFGFCRHDPKTETALVVLSFLPWHESFTKFLNVIAELTHSAQSDELWKFLDAVYQSKVPDPGGALQIPYGHDESKCFSCQSPPQFKLPSIPENRNLTEYYNAIDVNNMMIVFASMLYERRIIFTSRRLNRLSACVQSANAVIYPMSWQHIFIPVLPHQLVDYLLAPMPYLIGVSNTLINRVRRCDIGEVVILDADNNTVETPFQDLQSLPPEVVKNLRAQLKNRAALLGDGVSRAFLRALVQLIGNYRDALRFQQGEKITFNADAFVESRPPPLQPFVRKMLELQIFQQFIEERLDILNAGLGFSDEFEMEVCNHSDKSSSKLKQQYREWLSTMRKDTSAFFKNVKSRANPAMKSAVKTVKERGKNVGKAYKGIRSKFRDQPRLGLPEEGAGVSSVSRPRTVTAFSTTAASSYRRELNVRQRFSTPDSSSQYSTLSPSSPEATYNLSPLDMDLMGDLQDFIFRNCSSLNDQTESPTGDRALKPVRSLESFPAEQSQSGADLFGASLLYGHDDSARLISTEASRLPPPRSSGTSRPTSQSRNEETNLIRLDSLSSVEDFDPLLSKETKVESEKLQLQQGISLTNPLYPYFTPQHLPQPRDQDLLKEYGLDCFNSVQSTPVHAHSVPMAAQTLDLGGLSISSPPTLRHPPQLNWTKFD